MTDYAQLARDLREVVRLRGVKDDAFAELHAGIGSSDATAKALSAYQIAATKLANTHAPALLALAEAAAKGWRLVPTEPTEEMLAVADKLNPPFGPPERLEEPGYSERWRERKRKSWGEIYKAMLGALPEPPK